VHEVHGDHEQPAASVELCDVGDIAITARFGTPGVGGHQPATFARDHWVIICLRRCRNSQSGERVHQRCAPYGLANTTYAEGWRHRGADHDDWDCKQARVFSYKLNELPTVDTRHRQIGEDRNGESCRSAELIERIRTLTRLQDRVPACVEQVADQRSNIIVVIDDQQHRAYAQP
jgi:hypothetical protein